MNLLEQLATFCEPPVCVSFLDNSTQEKNNEKPARSVSLFATVKSTDTRQSKSIEKIQSWKPVSQDQIREKKLWKFSRTLATKVRKSFYHFWVNFQYVAKNAPKNQKSQKNQNLQIAGEKLSDFVVLYRTKNSHNLGLSEAFYKISKYSSQKLAIETFQAALSNPVSVRKSIFFQKMHFIEKTELQIDVIFGFCFNYSRKLIGDAFTQIKKYTHSIQNIKTLALKTEEENKKQKQEQVSFKQIKVIQNQFESRKAQQKKVYLQKQFPSQQLEIKDRKTQNKECLTQRPSISQVSISNRIKIRAFGIAKSIKVSVQQQILTFIEGYERVSMPQSKVATDSAFENFPEICDNVLFFDRPKTTYVPMISKVDDLDIKFSELELKQPEIADGFSHKKRRSFSKPENPTPTIQFKSSINEINLGQGQLTMKKQYPKLSEKTSSKLFNIDESRIQKLQRKIFGDSHKKQSKNIVDSDVWRSDRQTLAQIINVFKTPSISRRNSGYELQLDKIRQKIAGYESKQNTEKRSSRKTPLQKGKLKQNLYSQKPSLGSHQQKESLFKGKIGQENVSKVQKITISLKTRTKRKSQDLSVLQTPIPRTRGTRHGNGQQSHRERVYK